MQGRYKKTLSLITLTCIVSTAVAAKLTKDQQQFINSFCKTNNIPKEYVVSLFNKSTFDPQVIKQINFPYEKKTWDIYRTYFVTQKRATEGVVFWEQHKKALAQIQQRFGIPPYVVVAVLGVETNFGTNIGTYSAFNALNTLAFNYPKRQRFFRRELGQLILLSHQQQMDPLTTKSSYAGALGIPQFMPSTYRHYAVDFDNTKKIDLLNNFDDAMASVANYFNKHGWKAGQPIATQFNTTHTIKAAWISDRAIPKVPISTWQKRGLKPLEKINPEQKAALIKFDVSKGKQPIYWLTFQNFRVIMNYNPSTAYAMAVYELSQQIKKDHERYKAH